MRLKSGAVQSVQNRKESLRVKRSEEIGRMTCLGLGKLSCSCQCCSLHVRAWTLPTPPPLASAFESCSFPGAPPQSYALTIGRHTPSAYPTCTPAQHSAFHCYIALNILRTLTLSPFSITASITRKARPITPPCRGRLRLTNKQGLYGSRIHISNVPMSSRYLSYQSTLVDRARRSRKTAKARVYKKIMRKALVFELPVCVRAPSRRRAIIPQNQIHSTRNLP